MEDDSVKLRVSYPTATFTEVGKLIPVWDTELTMLGPRLPYFLTLCGGKKKNTQKLWVETHNILDDLTKSTMAASIFNSTSKQIKKGGGGLDRSLNKQIVKPSVQPSDNKRDALYVLETRSNAYDLIFKRITSMCWAVEHVENVKYWFGDTRVQRSYCVWRLLKISRINANISNDSHNLHLFGTLQAFNERWIFPCLFPSSFIILLSLFFVCFLWQYVALHWVLKSPIATSSGAMTHIGPRAPFWMCAAPFRPRLEYSCETTAPCRATRTHTHTHKRPKIMLGFFVCFFIFNLSTL